jgi:hypothetical protein
VGNPVKRSGCEIATKQQSAHHNDFLSCGARLYFMDVAPN